MTEQISKVCLTIIYTRRNETCHKYEYKCGNESIVVCNKNNNINESKRSKIMSKNNDNTEMTCENSRMVCDQNRLAIRCNSTVDW